jgi:prepilin-type N-terminal cleavage/methylation domain-containing protein
MADGRSRTGFTLIELGVALTILALVIAIAAQRYATVRDKARLTVAECDMLAIRDAFVGSATVPGYLDDMRHVPGFAPGFLRVANLLVATNLYVLGGLRADIDGHRPPSFNTPAAAFTTWNDSARRGWRGPYVRLDSARTAGATFPAPGNRRKPDDASFAERGFFPAAAHLSLPADYCDGFVYGFTGEPALIDPWGNPYVLQIPPPQAFALGNGSLANIDDEERFRYARLVSAGPDGILTTPCFFGNTNASGSAWWPAQRRDSIFAGRPADRGDDLVLFLSRPDRYYADYRQEGDER